MKKFLAALFFIGYGCGISWGAYAPGEVRGPITTEASNIAIDLSELELTDNTLEIQSGHPVDKWLRSNRSDAVFTAADLPPGLEITSGGNLKGTCRSSNMAYKPTFTATTPGGERGQVSFFIFVNGGEGGDPSGGDKDDGGGGGCNAGFAGLAAGLLALGLAGRKS